jgi:1-acyl-sn-glycerol-3-phosphate acyltransferase
MNTIFTNVPQQQGQGVLAMISRALLRLLGWRRNIPADLPLRCVMIVYPHTSNWDFPMGLLCKWASGMQVSYLGKDSLFRSPLGWLFRATGGIPVDRANPKSLVPDLIARFAQASTLRLAIAPEGTRAYVPALKSGFYRIAVGAKVPLVLATIDFGSKRIGVLETLSLSGREADDLPKIAAAYAAVKGYTPENMGGLKI